MKLDFSEVKDGGSIVPEGTHSLTIDKAQEKRSKNGTNMLVLFMKDDEGNFVADNVLLEGPGAFKAQQFIAAAGINKEDFEQMSASDFVGMTITAEVTVEPYEGVDRSRIKKYLA